MNSSIDFSSWSPLVGSLLHTLWQGALIAVVISAILAWVPGRRANRRYGLALGGLAALVLCWVVTWSWLDRDVADGLSEGSLPVPRATQASEVDRAQTASAEALDNSDAEMTAAADQPEPGIDWRRMAGWVWIWGALLFQVRLFGAVLRARGLIRQSRPVPVQAFGSLLSSLRERLGIRCQVELRETANYGPAVWGFLKPVILLPGTLVSGASPEQLEAILAHELAHVRRHDFTVNLVQTAIEGLFFFNPFAWWLSRQIRREREACCDAVAVASTGGRLSYAQALLDMAEAESVCGNVPAVALAMAPRDGSLRDRVRRLLEPAGYPEIRLPAWSVAGVLVGCGLALGALKVTTDAAVRLLTPEERMERFEELRSAHPVQAPLGGTGEDAAQITVSGRVFAPEGEPLPEGVSALVKTERARHSGVHATGVDKSGLFSERVSAGSILVAAYAPGYAPAVHGPVEAIEDLTGIELALKRGHTATLRFVDPDGHPIAGVKVRGSHDFEMMVPAGEVVSGEDGTTVFEGLGDTVLRFEAIAESFEPAVRRDVTLKAGELFTWTMLPAEATRGVVVWEDSGEPVAGAEILLGAQQGPNPRSYGLPEKSTVLGRANENGAFELNQLRSDSLYYLLVRAPGASGIATGPVRAGATGLRFELPRARYLDVKVPDIQPEQLDRSGKLRLTYTVTLRYGKSHSHSSAETFSATPADGEAEFRVGPLWRTEDEIRLAVAGRSARLTWSEAVNRSEPVVLEAPPIHGNDAGREARSPERLLRIITKTPRNLPPPAGAVLVEYVANQRLERTQAPLRDGRADVRIPAPTHIEVKPQTLVGYWFPAKLVRLDPNGDELVEIELELSPAGAIHGRVVEEGGDPARGVLISVFPDGPLPNGAGSLLGIEVSNSSSSSDHLNQFMAGPLPLGGRYVICAHRGATYALTESILIDSVTPFREVELVMPRGEPLEGRMLDPEGAPVQAVEVGLNFSPNAGHGFSGAKAWTDRDGYFRFEAVNLSADGDYYIEWKPGRRYQPVRPKVTPGQALKIQLEYGRIIEGQVIDASDGRALSGAEVYAMRVHDYSRGPVPWPVWVNADELADERGRFRFSTLPEGAYRILSRSGKVTGPESERTVVAGTGRTVRLAIEPYAWSQVEKAR